MKHALILISVFSVLVVQGQLNDDFSDGNYTANPQWTGSTADFEVNGGKLELNSTQDGGSSYLSTANTRIVKTEWQFYVELDFSPSSQNNLKIYLSSDQSDLSTSTQGYFLQIGESGSTDGIDLYRNDNGNEVLIANGRDGHASGSSNTLNIKVIRDSNGNWQVWSDSTGGNNYSIQGQATDNTYTSSNYFGIICNYTSTRKDKFAFDDFVIKEYIPDTDPPILQSATATSSTQLILSFNENLDAQSASQTGNFSFQTASITITNAELLASGREIRLSLNPALQSGNTYAIRSSNISDVSGNTANQQSASFTFFEPSEGDILINEFLADPTPSQGLPEAEFIELLNNSDFDISLNDYEISDASSEVSIGNYQILAGEHIILCSPSDTSDFKSYGKIIPVSLPALNNSGDKINLSTDNGLVLDSLEYDNSWFIDPQKASGGFSLERINPNDPCSDETNWRGSLNNNGGTPGSRNSVFDDQDDEQAPVIDTIRISSETELLLEFNESLINNQLLIADFQLSPNISIQSIQYPFENDKQAKIDLSSVLMNKTDYNLNYSGLEDCWGNVSSNFDYSFTYVVPEEAELYDVVINEIFADFEPNIALPEEEFVELYNRSDKILSLEKWKFADASSERELPNVILQPGEYVILTTFDAASNYSLFGELMLVSSLPSLNNSGDEISISDSTGKLIHFVNYSSEWHKDDLRRQGGYTLEQIDPDNPCGGEDNWGSSESSLGGTPGEENSIFGKNPDKIAPLANRLSIGSNRSLILYFSESLDSLSASSTEAYQLDDGRFPDSVTVFKPGFQRVKLVFNDGFDSLKTYELSVNANSAIITDCSGNVAEETTLAFGLPKTIKKGDVVINEVLFNPYTGGKDFVELYNKSDKILDVGELYITTYDDSGNFADPAIIAEEGFLLLPGEYMVVTEEDNKLEEFYTVQNPAALALTDLPSYNNDEGEVSIIKVNGNVIDELRYSDEWHYSLLDDLDGVSLERIDPNGQTQDQNNWQSASSSVDYATPTYKNSQFSEEVEGEGEVFLNHKLFSPNGDGFRDVLKINYRFNEGGKTANARIFNSEGVLIREINNNQLIGNTGFVSWDGTTDNGQGAATGVYIILFEVFSVNGDQEVYKLGLSLKAN